MPGRRYVADARRQQTEVEPAGGKPVTAWLCGRKVQLRPQFIKDVDEVARLLRMMHAANPRITSFISLAGRDGHIDRGRVEAAVEYGFRPICWHFAEPRP